MGNTERVLDIIGNGENQVLGSKCKIFYYATICLFIDPKQNSCDDPEAEFDPETEHEDFIYTEYAEGSLVWARMGGYPWYEFKKAACPFVIYLLIEGMSFTVFDGFDVEYCCTSPISTRTAVLVLISRFI